MATSEANAIHIAQKMRTWQKYPFFKKEVPVECNPTLIYFTLSTYTPQQGADEDEHNAKLRDLWCDTEDVNDVT